MNEKWILPSWVHYRKVALEELWGPQRVLQVYPLSRQLLVAQFSGVALLWSLSLIFLSNMMTGLEHLSLSLLVGALVFYLLMSAGCGLLLADDLRTSLLVTNDGVELRQPFFRTRAVRWEEIHQVEVHEGRRFDGAAVLVLKTGERILSKATSPGRGHYNGFQMRDRFRPDGSRRSPEADALIRFHRAWLASHLTAQGGP